MKPTPPPVDESFLRTVDFGSIVSKQRDNHVRARALLSKQEIRFNNLGRNAPCPCKSGKKFKHCCDKL